MKLSTNIPKDKLISLGIILGKFTKKKNFRLSIQCLPVLSDYALNKVWLKPSSEMSFLYGHHVPKAGVQKITQDISQYCGVVVFNTSDIALGFGITAQKSELLESMATTSAFILHQADIGEYLRDESRLS